MQNNSPTKSIAFTAIDEQANALIGLSKDVWDHPESGFREHRTAKLTSEFMRSIELAPRENIAITGVVAKLDTGRPGPHIAVMGELDSLIVPEHRNADPDTGAAHVCGHNIQIGNMLAAAVGLSQPDVLSALSGSISFMAVPAEEYIEIEYREQLRESGELEFLAGKQEFIRLGELDDVDISMLTHASPTESRTLQPGVSHNGMIAKTVRFIGRSAHAGGAPHLGINALNAANLAMQGIALLRETFRDEDHIRIHPIITRGGAAVSSVPANVTMEMFIRAANVEAMQDAEVKVDRALKGAAMTIGATVEISTSPGYMPSLFDPALGDLYEKSVVELLGESATGRVPHRTSSTDMGDISMMMPTLHAYASGASGRTHSDEFEITDWQLDVIDAGKAMVSTVIDLLANDGTSAKDIIANFDARLSQEKYLETLRGFQRTETWNGE
ncbi:MAG: amidohydrolase [Chloroflexi bacterium]|jgi:amidohydrolase|nr:amidohydrolase [Chloroflexota bacterium]